MNNINTIISLIIIIFGSIGLFTAANYLAKKVKQLRLKTNIELNKTSVSNVLNLIGHLDLTERIAILQTYFGNNFNLNIKVLGNHIIFIGAGKETEGFTADESGELKKYTG